MRDLLQIFPSGTPAHTKRRDKVLVLSTLKMMKIPWTDKICNEDVLSRAQVKRHLMKEIRVGQLNFLGYIIRKDGLENLAITGRIEGKRSRGRRSVTWMSSVKGLLQERGVKHQVVELIERTRNRKLWLDMIAYVQGYGT